MKTGSINVTSENIFPVIKKFLYSDHEIFLRELVSNAVDATQKLKTLARAGEYQGSTDGLKVSVSIDPEAGTLTVSDNGIGMTAEEIDKYINQIAFSGATEFLEKYKNDGASIIGHFGLGFYSAFMVAKKVEIVSKSYKDAPATRWSCEGNTEFTMDDAERTENGTDIILWLDDENKANFSLKSTIEGLLKKYCKYLPVPVVFGKKTEWKDGKEVDTDEDNQINEVSPLWTRQPSDLKDEDYLNFYHDLYPMAPDPLFWIHLNVDYPFNLTGVLYFPKIENNEFRRDRIQLYCNQVFVTDQVEGVVPEFMMLLHGVIDSPDIPLNVSRSYLQSDQNVKKISGYITKKVADRLLEIFNEDRQKYEEKWDDLKIFIQYGMLSEDKFYDKAINFALIKNTEGNYYTAEEYRKLVEGNQTDKDGQLCYLYTDDKVAQYSYIEAARQKGYDVIETGGQLDTPWMNQQEQKQEKCHFSRIDADTLNNLIKKADQKKVEFSEGERRANNTLFQSQIPDTCGADGKKVEWTVDFQAMEENDKPVMVSQNEWMRRMKEMNHLQGGGMSFYGQMPDQYTLIVNTEAPTVKKIFDAAKSALNAELSPLATEISDKEAQIKPLEEEKYKAKAGEFPQDKDSLLDSLRKDVEGLKAKEKEAVGKYAVTDVTLRQLIDLALLEGGMLRGEALAKFIKRSQELL
ncbi:MAG: molecular chaperone HtpG [Bacteroidales bacterium]|nr:molecular chaperone HtpG [Candidatus Liminaster caballi]